MNPLQVISSSPQPWTREHDIRLLSSLKPSLLPIVMKKLEERGLVEVKSDDEGGHAYQLTPQGFRHVEELDVNVKKSSSYPPPRISWPPVVL